MNKAYLVALREYMENLKTKTFWIGIMIFPLILILSFLVPIWLEKGKDVRYYAVIDKSGWLLDAVEERAAMPDMEKVLTEALEKHARGGEDFEKLPELLKQSVALLAKSIDDQIVKQIGDEPGDAASPEERKGWKEERTRIRDKMVDLSVKQLVQLTEPEGLKSTLAGMFPEATLEEAQQKFDKEFKEPIQKWWHSLPPEEARKYASNLDKSRYARVKMDLSGPDAEEKLKEKLGTDELFAYFVIGEDPVGAPKPDLKPAAGDATLKPGEEAPEANPFKYVSNNLTDSDLKNWFQRNANAIVSAKRIEKAAIAKATADWIKSTLVFEAKQISEKGEEEVVGAKDTVRQWAPAVFAYVLWISVFVIAQMLLTNTIEEKSNKIMEVLLSSVSPIQLMAGKIVGIASTGLTMVISWVVFFLLSIKCMPLFLDTMPDFDLTIIIRDPIYLASFVAYFVLGYLLLSAILVGIGSVCSSLKEAQNLMGPVTIIMIVPLLALAPISQDPNGTIAKIMSYIPPFTPFVMMNRAAGPPSTMEYVVTTILLVVSIAITLWAAAKIFRIGILMTGKPPKLLEILRWVRAPVGQVPTRKE
ncbi:MAG: ABC transporter permease [Planctomycetota bacterium]